VPTVAERGGDFSGVAGVQLINPNNGQPIPGNILQNAGLAIDRSHKTFEFIPLPNVTGAAPKAPNFHFVTSTLNDSDDLNIRLNQTLGGRQQRPRPRVSGDNVGREIFEFRFPLPLSQREPDQSFPNVGATPIP